MTPEDIITFDALRAELAKAKSDAALWEAREAEVRRYFAASTESEREVRAVLSDLLAERGQSWVARLLPLGPSRLADALRAAEVGRHDGYCVGCEARHADHENNHAQDCWVMLALRVMGERLRCERTNVRIGGRPFYETTETTFDARPVAGVLTREEYENAEHELLGYPPIYSTQEATFGPAPRDLAVGELISVNLTTGAISAPPLPPTDVEVRVYIPRNADGTPRAAPDPYDDPERLPYLPPRSP